MPQKKIGESSMVSCVSMHNGTLTSGVLGTSNVHCDLISTNSFKLNVDFKTSSIPSPWVSYFFSFCTEEPSSVLVLAEH